jgi:hypothetical protein
MLSRKRDLIHETQLLVSLNPTSMLYVLNLATGENLWSTIANARLASESRIGTLSEAEAAQLAFIASRAAAKSILTQVISFLRNGKPSSNNNPNTNEGNKIYLPLPS